MADNQKYVQNQSTTIYGSGCSIGDTSIVLTDFVDIDGNQLDMSDFGTKGFGTIEPNSTNREEQISFTGITQNSNGTATLTGLSSVGFLYPYSETSGVLKSHPGGVVFVISNTAGFYDTFASKNNDELINGTYTFSSLAYPRVNDSSPLPTDNEEFATKVYVDGVAIAGAPDASVGVKGITRLSSTPVAPTTPIAVGDNDARMPTTAEKATFGYIPTAGEKQALVGTVGTPSTANKYVSALDTAYVITSGAQTINGAKTFGSAVVVTITTPVASGELSSKAYVDQQRLYNVILAASNNLKTSADTERNKTADTNYTKVKEIQVFQFGVIRCNFDLHSNQDGQNAYAKVYINGTPVTDEMATGSVAYRTFVSTPGAIGGDFADLTVGEGDKIQLYYKTTTTYMAYARNFRLYWDKGLQTSDYTVITD